MLPRNAVLVWFSLVNDIENFSSPSSNGSSFTLMTVPFNVSYGRKLTVPSTTAV